MGAWRSYGYSYKQLSLVVICQGHVSIHSPSFINLALCFQEQKICTVFHSGLLIKSLPKLPETYQNHLETYGFHYLWIDFHKLYFAGNFLFSFFFFLIILLIKVYLKITEDILLEVFLQAWLPQNLTSPWSELESTECRHTNHLYKLGKLKTLIHLEIVSTCKYGLDFLQPFGKK